MRHEGAEMSDTTIWPTELRVAKDRKSLKITFNSGEAFEISAEMLRVLSPSAEVQGHSPEQRITVWGKRDITISEMVPIGNYAVRIVFDDRHDTGIFTWTYLARLGRDREALWQEHLDELQEKGLSR
tara:strand:- start:2385 stop:2765 length:381 start_codon:yes stop_codon:yes gene_type:complete